MWRRAPVHGTGVGRRHRIVTRDSAPCDPSDLIANPVGERVATGPSKTYPTITDNELDRAIPLAHAAHQGWLRSTTVEQRSALARRVGELHSERREQLAGITVREMGEPTEQALGEIGFCADIYGYYADNGPDLIVSSP